ncbi:MAG: serine protease, partial [Prevotella sp.]
MRHRIQLLILGFFLVLESLFAAAQTENTPSTNWYRVYSDSVQGINLDAAMRYLSVSKLKPKGKVVVGVIDSGVDTTSIDLKSALWVNQKEIPGDGIDNDRNGYTDDVHGWNFLGTKDGSFQMTSAGTEEYRQFKRLYPKYKSLIREQAVDKNEFDFYQRMKKKAGIT